MSIITKVTYYHDYKEMTEEDFNEYRFTSPSATFSFETDSGVKIDWNISEACNKTTKWKNNLKLWKDIRDSLDSGVKSQYQSGGGNAYWESYCNGTDLIIQYNISGRGGDSVFTVTVPQLIAIPLIDSIIQVTEYAERNEEYPDANIEH